jgi:membrane protease YdiL (CAAX protease family)
MTKKDWRGVHGGLLLLFLPIPMLIPDLGRWPWHILVPLLGYAIVVCLVGPLRRSVNWLHFGLMDRQVLAVTAAIVLISSTALVLYCVFFHPDLGQLREHFPAATGITLLLLGAYFSIVNALMEEVMFRGIVMDALESQLQPAMAWATQAVAFGAAHYHGFPPGPVGIVLASIYGLMLGLLRWWARGLAAPVLAHVFADATIFAIVISGA